MKSRAPLPEYADCSVVGKVQLRGRRMFEQSRGHDMDLMEMWRNGLGEVGEESLGEETNEERGSGETRLWFGKGYGVKPYQGG